MSGNAAALDGLKVVRSSAVVLDLPELAFEEGKTHVLVGANGAGKTTLLRVLAGLDEPTLGTVRLFGVEPAGLSGKRRLDLLRRVTLCFQKPYLFRTSVRRNVEYGLRFRRLPAKEAASRVDAALDAVGLCSLEGREAATLSAGEAQRVSLARALAVKPDLALLDEPIANVDPANRTRVERAISDLRRSGATVIVATHQLDQAYRLSAGVVCLEQGKIAPAAVENLLEGEVVERGGRPAIINVSGVGIEVVATAPGVHRAAVDPAGIIVSMRPVESSARNCLPGRVVALEERGHLIALTADVGFPLRAHITRESFAGLGVTLGARVYLVFKASSVVVF